MFDMDHMVQRSMTSDTDDAAECQIPAFELARGHPSNACACQDLPNSLSALVHSSTSTVHSHTSNNIALHPRKLPCPARRSIPLHLAKRCVGPFRALAMALLEGMASEETNDRHVKQRP